jgi:hypothetical protein
VGIPTPEPGLVLNYAYLWHDEYLSGSQEGRKDRPSVIVFCATQQADQTVVVTVLPITHSPPSELLAVVEIPKAIKSHLGLDDNRSWVVVSEGNEFVWPGYDLRKVTKSGEYGYGYLPPRFFAQVRDAFVAYYRTGRTRTASRL